MAYKVAAVLSIEEHRKLTAEYWKDPRCIEQFAKYVEDNPTCYYCGEPTKVPHHIYPADYRSLEVYLTVLWIPGHCIPVDHPCHRKLHSGWIECPECGRLMKQGYETCFVCREYPDLDDQRIKEAGELVSVTCPHCGKLQGAILAPRYHRCEGCGIRFKPEKNLVKLR